MKNLRRFCGTVVLALTLTISATAGHIEIPAPAPPPATPTTPTSHQQGQPSSINTTGVSSVGEITLSLLESLLALF